MSSSANQSSLAAAASAAPSSQQHNNFMNPNLAQLSYKGSISSLFNGDSTLLYNQFELFNREQKWIQISLIQECIFKIKENFNKEFETIMQRKVQEIARIKEKNQRLKQIYQDLNEDKQLDEPALGDSESPENLFKVRDDEVTTFFVFTIKFCAWLKKYHINIFFFN